MDHLCKHIKTWNCWHTSNTNCFSGAYKSDSILDLAGWGVLSLPAQVSPCHPHQPSWDSPSAALITGWDDNCVYREPDQMISQTFFVSKPVKLCVFRTVRIEENRLAVTLVHKKDINVEINMYWLYHYWRTIFLLCTVFFKFHEKDSW